MTDKEDDFVLVHGSGNIFEDLGHPNAEIIGVLDDRKLTVRKADELTGYVAADFFHIRNVRLKTFTIDRFMAILRKVDQKVEISVTMSAAVSAARTHAHIT
tara:strand:- start:8957 stop:9259 length:303 start_codon:yes stop_codon:yes gene_type:complete